MSNSGLELIRKIAIFRDLSEDELIAVHRLAVEKTLHRGEIVFMEGEERESVYFIERGLVKVYKVDEEGREHIVNVLGMGSMFPHVGFFQDSPYPGTAQVMVNTTVLAIQCAQFDDLLVQYPNIARKVMRMMGDRILQLQAKLQEIALFDSHERVIALLRHFAEEHGTPHADGIHVKLPMTHGEMARMIGMTRESVNRVWNQLRKNQMISGDREDWVLHVERL